MSDQQHTLSASVRAVLQQYQISPVQPIGKPIERVALGTPVMLFNGVLAAVCGHSTCDCQNYQVCYLDRHVWQVRRRWVHRSRFEVTESKTATEVAA